MTDNVAPEASSRRRSAAGIHEALPGIRRAAAILFSAFLLAAVAFPASAATPVGRWRLVEQNYAGGQANFVDVQRPVRLQLVLEGSRLKGRIWEGDDESAAFDWPAHVTDAGPVPVEVTGRIDDVASGIVEVRYRVPPVPGDDLVLEIVERYEAQDDGLTLTGTVHVSFTGGEMNRGGFVLHRRWERER